MPRYTPPIADMQYLLHDVLNVSGSDIPGYREMDRDLTGAILHEAGKLAAEVLLPLNAVGDREGCRLENGAVRTPTGFKAAYDQLRAGGWLGLDCSPEHGGQGMPHLLGTAVGEMFVSANIALNIYQGLTHGALNTLEAHGSETQKATFLPKMVAGEWSGTMNLTEPQCGTDLGLIRTSAVPAGDGSYRITGQKIWISAGEHDLTDNIIHLVLARLPDAPAGTRGISLFVVPKFLVDAHGECGARNALVCGGLEEKMGLHGNATCVMHYEGATGWLVGAPHAGLRAMFTMMNAARLAVGMQGYAQGAIACQTAAAFARERLQGRAATGAQNPEGAADPIIVHPDVRRNLMHQRSFIEGARALAFWGAQMIDAARRAGDAEADAMVSLLIPVIKGFLTDKGFETTVLAQQTLGGSGFTRDGGVEQFVRDARITMIYEGTNGIQSLDLVGRKLGQDGGKTFRAFLAMASAFAAENAADARLRADFLDPLTAATGDLQAAAVYFLERAAGSPEDALAGSHDFMHLFGHVCLGLMWARMARASLGALDGGAGDAAFHRAKLITGRYYMARHLPATALHLARIRTGAQTVMELDADAF